MNMRRSRAGNQTVQFAASFPADDEDYREPARKGGGIGRIVAVVVLMHVVFIGGFAAFKKIGHDEPVATTATSKTETAGKSDAKAAAVKADVDEALAPIDLAEKRIIVDHPTMKGFSRYRVSAGEQLAEVARQFNASVAEIERLNDLKSGKPLRVGQWLTVPGSAAGTVAAKNETAPSTPTPVTASAQTTTKEATTSPMRATVITEGKEPAKPAAPTPRVVEVKPAPVTLKPVPIAPKPAQVANTPAPRPTVATSGAPGRTYTVMSGDTAYRIALKHGVQWQELLAHNGMKDPLELKAGQTLRIP